MSNKITAYFKGRVGVAESVYQNDYGIVMEFDSIDLPTHFDCYFSKLNQEEAVPAIGADNRVVIPNSILADPGNMTIHIPLHTGESDSEVEYVIYFKVIGRARPIDDGTPAQMTAIEQALALLQNPITNIEQIVNEALDFTGDTFDEMQAKLDADQAEFEDEMQAKQSEFESEINSDFEQLNSQFNNLATNVKANSVNTLWTGTLKAKNDSATLSESVANFDYIDIYTGSTDNRCVRKKVSDLSSVVKIQGQNLYDMSGGYGLAESEIHLSISGTTATIVKTINFSWNGEADQAADSSADSYDAECPIIRIDGVKIGSHESAELTDIRVGADGITDTTAGASVRRQFSALKSDLTNIESELYGGTITSKLSDETVTEGAYVTNTGTVVSSGSYAYGYVDIHGATSISVTLGAVSSGSVVINMCGETKAHKRNLNNWVGTGTYSITPQTGDYYLCISCYKTQTAEALVSATYLKGDIDDLADGIDFANANANSRLPSVKMYGGYINRTLTDIVTGKYVNNVGSEVTSSAWCYGFVDISDAKLATVRQTGISDSTIINMVDKNKAHLTNNATWQTSDFTLDAIPYTAKYLCISCKQVDLPLISVDVEQIPVIDEIDHNTDDSVRYDSATAYIRTNTPDFIKGVHLDCGRKYFSVANIKLIIDAMYSAGLNTFQIYFSDDNGFRFGLDDMDITVDGVTYDLGDALGDGASPTDGSNKWLTESEMDEIIDYAHSKGIEVIPAFDMPSHMGAIRQNFPINSVVLRARYGLSGERGVKFMLAIIKKYADYFASKGSKYYNICCDETNAITDAEIEMFMARACKQITECHLTPMLYNDNVCINGYNNPYINTGAVVYGWIKRDDQAPYSQISDCGFRMINCASNYGFYWVLGTTVTDEARLNIIRNIDIFKMADGSIMRNIKGAMYHIWCDQADADGADDGDNVTEQVIPCIEAFGEAIAKYVPNTCVPSGENIQTVEDLESMKDGGGVILKSANGTKYKLTIGNDGTVNVNAVL